MDVLPRGPAQIADVDQPVRWPSAISINAGRSRQVAPPGLTVAPTDTCHARRPRDWQPTAHASEIRRSLGLTAQHQLSRLIAHFASFDGC